MNKNINVCVMGIDDTSTFNFSGNTTQALELLKEKFKETGIYVLDECNHITDLIKQSDAIIIFLPICDFKVIHKRTDIKNIIKIARERDVKVFYISEYQYTDSFRMQFYLSEDEACEAKEMFNGSVFLSIQDGNFIHSIRTIVAEIYNRLNVGNEKDVLYDKLSEMQRLDYDIGIADVACQLIALLHKELCLLTLDYERKRQYKEIFRLWLTVYHTGYFNGSIPVARAAAHTKIDTTHVISSLLDEKEFKHNDIYYAALALNFIYLNALILHDSVESITNDDVHILRENNRKNSFIEQQKPFYKMICDALTNNDSRAYTENLPRDEKELIYGVKEVLVESLYIDSHGGVYLKKAGVLHCIQLPQPKESPAHTEEEKILLSIADIMHKATKLFYDISDNVKAIEYMRCLKTSYERLKNYCEIVGDKRIAAECITKIAEIVNIIEKHSITDSVPEKIGNGIKAYLGLKLSTNDKFDVFLSYKHEDKDLARKCYYYLKENHLHTFLDFITLPELSNSDYEEAIMRALDHSQHFVVIITKLEQLESHWIKLEMKTFEHEMSEGRKEHSNFIFLVSDDVFDKILSSNKRCLPIRYRSMEVIKISNYRETLSSYLAPLE